MQGADQIWNNWLHKRRGADKIWKNITTCAASQPEVRTVVLTEVEPPEQGYSLAPLLSSSICWRKSQLWRRFLLLLLLVDNKPRWTPVKVAAEAFPALCSHSRRVSPRRGSGHSSIRPCGRLPPAPCSPPWCRPGCGPAWTCRPAGLRCRSRSWT